VNAVTVKISDAARSTQTRQRSGISSGRRIQEMNREDFKSDYSETAIVIIDCNSD
jgi:hypothetical protein